MIYEAIVNGPLIIPGDPPSRANIGMDYRLKNVPVEKIRNKNLAGKKRRWDATNQYKDFFSIMLRNHFIKNRTPFLGNDHKIFLSMVLYYQYKKKGGRIQDLRKDIENCEKGINDAIQNSGVIGDDCQIAFKLVGKTITPNYPRVEIYSLCAAETASDLGEWIKKQVEIAPHLDPVYFDR